MPAQRQFAPPQRPPMRAHRPSPQARRSATASDRPSERGHVSWFGLGAAFGLKLIITAVAGAMVTVLLWPESREPAVPSQPDRQETAADAHRAETIVYRRMPQGHSGPAWETQSVETWSDQPPPSNYPRRVKTVKFTPPGQEATAAIPPTASLPRSAAFPSIRPALVKSWRYQLQDVNPDEIANSSVRSRRDRLLRRQRTVLQGPSRAHAAQVRRLSPHHPVLHEHRRGRELPLVLAESLVVLARPRKSEMERKLRRALLASGLAGDHLRLYRQASSPPASMASISTRSTSSRRWATRGDGGVRRPHRGARQVAASRFPGRSRKTATGFIADSKFRRAHRCASRAKTCSTARIRTASATADQHPRRRRRLKMVAAEGKPVLVVEYPRNDKQARTARREISEAGFIGLIARRALDAP